MNPSSIMMRRLPIYVENIGFHLTVTLFWPWVCLGYWEVLVIVRGLACAFPRD